MKRFACLLIAATCSLTAQQYMHQPPPRASYCPSVITTTSAGIGYRYDQQRFEQSSLSLFYLENLSSLQTTFSLSAAWDRLILKFAGDYSWLLSGSVPFKGLGGPYAPNLAFPSLSIGSGYAVDVQPSLACRIVFWKFCPGSLSFIPLLGYNYNHFNAYPKGQARATPAGTLGFTTMEFSRPIQQDWYGPVFEGRIAFAWREQLRIDFFYQYLHWNFRQTYSQSVSNYFFSAPGTFAVADTSTIRSSSKGDTLRTQLGGADISYRGCRQWQVGAHFEGSATWSNTAKSTVRIKRDFFLPASTFTNTASTDRLTVHWIKYLGNIYASYWF